MDYNKQYEKYMEYIKKTYNGEQIDYDLVLNSNLDFCLVITSRNHFAKIYSIDESDQVVQVGQMKFFAVPEQSLATVNTLDTLAPYRQQGYASALLTYIKRLCVKFGLSYISLFSMVDEYEKSPKYRDDTVDDSKDEKFKFYKNNDFYQIAPISFGLRPMTCSIEKIDKNTIDIPTIYSEKVQVRENIYEKKKIVTPAVQNAVTLLHFARARLKHESPNKYKIDLISCRSNMREL